MNHLNAYMHTQANMLFYVSLSIFFSTQNKDGKSKMESSSNMYGGNVIWTGVEQKILL